LVTITSARFWRIEFVLHGRSLGRKTLKKKFLMLTCFLKTDVMLVMKKFEEGLHSIRSTGEGFWLTLCVQTPSKKEENFLLSEENIYEYMCLHAYDILVVCASSFKLLKECLKKKKSLCACFVI
jgi:hypothetical protein